MINTKILLRPSTYLIDANKQYPQAWKLIDEHIQKYHHYWPKWCFLPSNTNIFNVPPEEQHNVPSSLFQFPCLAAWRATQGVYKFDPNVIEPLWDTPITGNIPIEVLFNIPEWCVYVETGKRDFLPGRKLHGFFACLDFMPGVSSEISESIFIYLDVENEGSGESSLNPFIFPLKIGADASPTIAEMIEIYMDTHSNGFFPSDPTLWVDQSERDVIEGHLKNFIPRIFSLLLYLCSENAEFRGTAGNSAPSKYPAPTKTKKGLRFFPPNQPAVWDTAWRIGASIRSFRDNTHASIENETGQVKRPHIRRAHWHSFWTGPLNSERTIRIKWLPPISVNVDSAEDLIPVVRGVE